MTSRSSPHFPTTAWSVVRAAQDHDSAESWEAMNRCIAAYWKPVFYFLRAKGYPLHRAEDLTQEFFLQFFQRDWIRRADQQRGRFRTFLLTILTRFLADQSAARAPRQQSFETRLVAISALVGDSERTFEPADDRTPEDLFMQQWALAVIANVRRNLETWCSLRGRPDWYRMFCDTYLRDPGSPRITQQALADRLHVSRDQVRYGLEEAHRQFVEFLRAEVFEQVGPDGDLDAEIRELETLLGD
jgi:RNA polymerase sigma-70 factor (ECF subfamily)